MKQFRLLVILTLALTWVTSAVGAQDKVDLAYGDTIQGEITDANFEFEYVFEGKAGDIIIIEMASAEESVRDAVEPVIFLLDPDGVEIIESEDGLPLYITTVSTVLPADGQYTILATRKDGRSGDDVGMFDLRLLQPLALLPGEPVTGTVDSSTGNQYYVVTGQEEATLRFQMNDAERFAPQFSVRDAAVYDNLLGYFTALNTVVTGTITVSGGDSYIVGVEYEKSDLIIYDDVRADFTVTLEG